MEQYIDSVRHPLYKPFSELYHTSFPVFEQRSAGQQEEAFRSQEYRLQAFTEGPAFIGFISFWEFGTYIYVEHFAINKELRGQGHGSRILRKFLESTEKTVILKIDPVIDEVSMARLSFYLRCGFHENPYQHRHPAYDPTYSPHPLEILSAPRAISPIEYEAFRNDLCSIVMRQH